MMKKKKKIVVIGGGTGTSVVLSGLKNFPDFQLTAVVTVADNGGSTGKLRDEFGFMPVGDLRQCLAALADGEHQSWVRKMLLYRFTKGEGLKGHNLGNLILTALEDISLRPGLAIETASNIFRIKGKVYPVTEKGVNLVIEYQDGTIRWGEKVLDNKKNGGQKIKSISLKPSAVIYPKSKKAIEEADLVILGPGDLYGSLLVNTLASGFKKSLKFSKAKFVYIVNLMTHYSQTSGLSASDHVNEVTKYCGREPDFVIFNNGQIPVSLASVYAREKEFAVKDDFKSSSTTVIKRNLVAKVRVAKNQSVDVDIERSLLRHDGDKLAKLLASLL